VRIKALMGRDDDGGGVRAYVQGQSQREVLGHVGNDIEGRGGRGGGRRRGGRRLPPDVDRWPRKTERARSEVSQLRKFSLSRLPVEEPLVVVLLLLSGSFTGSFAISGRMEEKISAAPPLVRRAGSFVRPFPLFGSREARRRRISPF